MSINISIMKIIDYFFYRIYLFEEKRRNPALFGGSLFTTLVIFNLTAVIWLPLFRILTKDSETAKFVSIIVFIICTIISFFRYKQKKNIIINQFKHSKYNQIIPDWCFIVMISVSALIGIAIVFLVKSIRLF